MSKLTTYTAKGTKAADTQLPKELSGDANVTLLAQAVRVYENLSHKGVSKTQTRGEVTASTRKIYRQKGTGRARHGALSAPIFVGGGKAHGPTGERRRLALSKKMKAKALVSALSLKTKDKKVAVIKSISTLKKTKEAQALLDKVVDGKLTHCVVALSAKNKETSKFFRNIKNVTVMDFAALNAYHVFRTSFLVLDEDAFAKEKTAKK